MLSPIQYFQKILISALVLALVFLSIFSYVKSRKFVSEAVDLRNQIAARDKTIEIQKDVYTKLTIQTDDIKNLLDSKNSEVSRLEGELKQNGQQLLNANQVALKWKKAYEASVSGTQTEVPGKDGNIRKQVDFNKDFGIINVKGWTLTDPPEAWIYVEQMKPLLLTLVMSQDNNGAWHSYVTSSDDNTNVELKVSAVNPYILEKKWYEKILLSSSLAIGSGDNGAGVLVGLGASYEFGHFDLGPSVFFTVTNHVDRYIGASFGWRPFQK